MNCKELAMVARTMKKAMVSELTMDGVTIKLSPLALIEKQTYTSTVKTPEQARKESEEDLYFSTTPTRKK